jgi:hypothetical protein
MRFSVGTFSVPLKPRGDAALIVLPDTAETQRFLALFAAMAAKYQRTAGDVDPLDPTRTAITDGASCESQRSGRGVDVPITAKR